MGEQQESSRDREKKTRIAHRSTLIQASQTSNLSWILDNRLLTSDRLLPFLSSSLVLTELPPIFFVRE